MTLKFKRNIFYFIVTPILVLGFNLNCFFYFPEDWFDRFQVDSESLILGRIAISRAEGVFSHSGLIGKVDTQPERLKGDSSSWFLVPWQFQYEAFAGTKQFSHFIPYRSQSGGQGMLFSILDRFLPFDANSKLSIFHWLASFLSAAIIALILTFIFTEFGIIAAICTLLLLLASPWFMVFGRNLYWCLWAFYLPMVVTTVAYKRFLNDTKKLTIILYSAPAAAFFVKCFFTGFEFVTSCVLMTLVPIVYLSIKNMLALKVITISIYRVITGLCLSLFVSLLILNFQITTESAMPALGMDHVFDTLERRGPADIKNSNIPWWEVLHKMLNTVESYFDAKVFKAGGKPAATSFWGKTIQEITFGVLGAVFFIASVVIFLFRYKDSHARLKYKALIVSTWVSILAPASWLICFNKHAAAHHHMDSIFWYMPFCIGGFVIVGLCIKVLCETGYHFIGIAITHTKTQSSTTDNSSSQ